VLLAFYICRVFANNKLQGNNNHSSVTGVFAVLLGLVTFNLTRNKQSQFVVYDFMYSLDFASNSSSRVMIS
jgi:hypothetical protein